MKHPFLLKKLFLLGMGVLGACSGNHPPSPTTQATTSFQAADCRVTVGKLQDLDSNWITSWYGKPAWDPTAPDTLADTRPAFLCTTPSRFSIALKQSPAPRQIHTAVRRLDLEESTELRCEIFWESKDPLRSLGFTLLAPGKDLWVDLQLEVPSTEGSLVFSARPAAPGMGEQKADPIAWARPTVFSASRESPLPDVLLLSIDTLRFDALKDMPYLQGLFLQGTRWEQAYAASNWTLPAMASLFTGLAARAHGCGRGPFSPTPTGQQENRAFRGLQKDIPTLAEAMQGAGYATAMFHQNPLLESWTGLQRGFQRYVRTADRPQANYKPAMAWWKASLQRPRFLSLHYMTPHLPNAAAGPLEKLPLKTFFSVDHSVAERHAFSNLPPEQRNAVRQAYRDAVGELDQQLAILLPEIFASSPNCHILVFVDHGEEHWDQGAFEHGFSFDDSVIHVPLAWIPGTQAKPKVIHTVVPAFHLGSYLLEQLSIPNALPPSVLGAHSPSDRTLVCEFPLYRSATGGRRWSPKSAWEDLPFRGEGSPGIPAILDPWTTARLAELGYLDD